MSVDPMALVAASRPGPAIDIGTPQPGALRRVRQTVIQDHSGHERAVDELDTRPGTAAYNNKIPPPPCAACGQDHNPMQEYNHAYVRPGVDEPAEAMSVVGGQAVPASAVPQPVVLNGSGVTRRMTLFPGKSEESYLLVVEERQGDDWEDVQSFVLASTVLSRVVPIFDTLGLKIKDRTGGDLVMLRNPNDAG